MKLGIIGSGGREHAICLSVKKSKNVNEIYCIPGNAGTAQIATNLDIDLNDFKKIKECIIEKNIDLLIVGPEQPLVDGLVDFLHDTKVKVFGPNKAASQLEGSKIFTKNLCKKYKIPTAKFGIFKNAKDSKKFVENTNFPVVIKADGLAAGKGVYICENSTDAYKAIDEIFNGKFGKAFNLLIEEFLEGEEMSYFVICDGKSIKSFETAQDHKRVMEGDKGKNTGGMGAYSPSRLINETLEKKIIDKIIKPTLDGLKDLQIIYKGFLYVGLMIVENEPFLIEYNVRMGDPECQTILPKLNTDFGEIIDSCCNGKLNESKINWNDKKSLCVVLCSKGYPENYRKKVEIENLSKIELNYEDYLFHAGTFEKEGKIFSIGGRVLNFVSLSNEFINARENVNKYLNKLNWTGGFYRKDIGYKVIDK